jgi:tetratricopeptide (TPR) repeat protein
VPEVPGIEPFFPPVRYAPGFAFLTRGQYEQAVASFKEASAADPLAVGTAGVVTLIDRAAAALRDGDPATAVGALEEAVRASPGRGDTHRLLGLAHLADGRIEPGLASLREAIRLAPRDERARLALADTLMQQARYVEAERALREALETLPDAGRTRYTLGLSYQRQGLYPDAVRELDASLAFAPLLGLNSVYDTIATLRRAQQDFEGATLAFARRADLVPNSASAHRDLGDIYFRQGLDDLAWLEFLVAEMLDPRDVTTQAALAQLHLRAGRHEAAVIASKRTLALDDTHKQAHYVLATALIRLGRMEEGAPALLVFNRLQAEEAQARSQQLELGGLTREAALSTARQEHARAVELLTRALALAPRSPEAHIDLGVALLQAGRAPDAVERLQAAAGLGAPSEVYRHLADAYAALGQQAESQRARDAYARIRRDELRQAGAR